MQSQHKPQNPGYRAWVEGIFEKAAFIKNQGIKLVDCGPGWCECRLDVRPDHLQQDGYVHAAVVAAMADHSAGASAGTLAPMGKMSLTVEFKINLLRPGIGHALRCRADVLRAGRSITVSESEVYVVGDNREKLIAKAIVTLALVTQG